MIDAWLHNGDDALPDYFIFIFLIKTKSVCQHKLKAKFKREFIFTEGPYKRYHKIECRKANEKMALV